MQAELHFSPQEARVTLRHQGQPLWDERMLQPLLDEQLDDPMLRTAVLMQSFCDATEMHANGTEVTLIKRRYRLAVMVQIIDNGPGIPPELQDKIFYPLVSGRADGHGLGLTLAQDFVSQHHGTIEFDSEPGRTRFTVLLPLP